MLMMNRLLALQILIYLEEKGTSGAETSYQWPERVIEAKNQLGAGSKSGAGCWA
ncbi:hypothetical protein ACYULU_13730 [Breznakiellaceae bacterium SP9]